MLVLDVLYSHDTPPIRLLFYLQRSCIIKFDGASKGNPGSSGAGVVMLADNGNLVCIIFSGFYIVSLIASSPNFIFIFLQICKLREGVGIATNNVAEYRGLLLGLKYALEKGFEKVTVFGDSKLVYMQVCCILFCFSFLSS